MKLNLAKPNTNYLKKSFSYSAASLWNNLPKNLRTIESVWRERELYDRLSWARIFSLTMVNGKECFADCRVLDRKLLRIGDCAIGHSMIA